MGLVATLLITSVLSELLSELDDNDESWKVRCIPPEAVFVCDVRSSLALMGVGVIRLDCVLDVVCNTTLDFAVCFLEELGLGCTVGTLTSFSTSAFLGENDTLFFFGGFKSGLYSLLRDGITQGAF